jgi:hypothetical protein
LRALTVFIMATPEEVKEIDELHDLFGHSNVPRGMFIKFEVSKANRAIADKARKDKEERQRLLEERAQEQKRRIEQLRQVRGERDREAVARHQQQNREAAQAIKEAEQAWEAQMQANQRTLKKQVRDRGSAQFHNARLAEQEAKMLQQRRDQAQAEYDAYKKQQQELRDRRMRERRNNAGKMREEVEHAHNGANQKLADLKGTLANEAKQDKREWKEQLKRNEEERLARARANRKHAEEVRQRARSNIEKQRKSRMEEGGAMKSKVDGDAIRARNQMMEQKRKLRQDRYKQRYASSSEAKLLEKSTFRKLYGLQKS